MTFLFLHRDDVASRITQSVNLSSCRCPMIRAPCWIGVEESWRVISGLVCNLLFYEKSIVKLGLFSNLAGLASLTRIDRPRGRLLFLSVLWHFSASVSFFVKQGHLRVP